MSEGLAMALVPMITSALSSSGQYMEAKSKMRAAEYNARAADWNARIVKQAAEFSMARIQRKKAKHLASQHALYSKAGVKMEGSTIEVMADSATKFELDKLAESYNAQVQIAALKSDAQNSRRQASQYRFASMYQPAMTLLTGAANAGMSYAMSNPSSSQSKYLTGKREYIGSHAGVRKYTG